ncbi:MAG: hypothetical protein EA397_14525 [Deltaproteobacteria bacterium]|nr:MAG: hypothetical protein EA397_14525 [Deltaproteobacteria bacterium]
MILRPATHADIPAMLDLRASLTFAEPEGATSTRGGFLLGTDADGYAQRIAEATSLVMDEGGTVQGFAIILPDPVFRASEIWARRDEVRWTLDPDAFQHASLCYFDQLAVRRTGYRSHRFGAAMALRAVLDIVPDHDYLVTATVVEPVCNLAAVPYLRRVGARIVGRIDETYPVIGDLKSDVWLTSRTQILERVASPRSAAEAWVVERAGAA